MTTRHFGEGHAGPIELCLDCRADITQPASKGIEAHAFTLAAEPVLRKALELVTERGGTHGDTWKLPMATPFVDSVLCLAHSEGPEWKRLLMCAAFLDMKMIRANRGAHNPDDLEDAVNYASALNTWLAEYHGDGTVEAILDHQLEHSTGG